MLIAVKHDLEVLDVQREDGPPLEAFCLPMAEAQAVMGETIAAFLKRVAWRFDLPTVCRIGDKYYSRDEWDTRALAVNDNAVQFVSRPLGGNSGGGSASKSILSVVALVALTAVAGPAGFVGSALTGALGSTLGAVASAAIVGAVALPIAAWLAPPAPWWRRALRTALRNSFRRVLAVTDRFWSLAR